MAYFQKSNKHGLSLPSPNLDIPKVAPGKLLVKENSQISNIQTVSQKPIGFKIPREDTLLSLNSLNGFKDVPSPVVKKTKFPETFNPRKELNMPHKEKVDNWMVYLPIQPSQRDHRDWDNDCYTPTLPIDIDQDDIDEEEEELESFEFKDQRKREIDFHCDSDVIDYQSKMITVLVNKAYYKETENVRRSDGKLVPNVELESCFVENYDYRGYPPMNQYNDFSQY